LAASSDPRVERARMEYFAVDDAVYFVERTRTIERLRWAWTK
jgi:hypothetical protein